MKDLEFKAERWLIIGIKLAALLSLFIVMISCGTIAGGETQYCQKTKPAMDHRQIRPWAFAGDILLLPIAMPIDFYTGGIYKPCNKYEINIKSGRNKLSLRK